MISSASARCYIDLPATKKHKGHELDSALTDPITERVQDAYRDFYQSESDAISSGMLTALAEHDVKLTSFLDRIADIALGKFSSKVKKQIVHLVADQIRESVQQGTLHTMGHQIGHITATAAGTQVAAVVAHTLIKLMAANVGQIVAHLLAMGFVQKMLMLIAKKIIVEAILSAVLHFLAVHVGAAVGSTTLMFVVAPLLAIYIGYKVYTFPAKTGEEVSKSVRNELAQNFESINRTMLEKIFHRVFGGNELVQAIAMDEDFVDMLNGFGRKLEGSNEAIATETDKDGLLVQVTEKNLDRRFVLVNHGSRMVNEDSHTPTPTS
jgi:hypothetical protein